MSVLLISLPPERMTEARVAQVRAAAPDLEVVVANERAEIERVLDEVEIAAGWFPHDLLPKARRLRWL
ncbi:MAG TPA: hypothetical protein VFU22_06755, partial [Roseiflexaceae bacterium]|nr:hypothetical protein [Roseiflexaceae bacterium]